MTQEPRPRIVLPGSAADRAAEAQAPAAAPTAPPAAPLPPPTPASATTFSVPPPATTSGRGGGARSLAAAPGEFGPVAVLTASLGLYAVASGVESDRGPLIVIGAAAWAVLLVGIVWPIIALRRWRCTVDNPTDAVVGEHVTLGITIDGRGAFEVRTLDPPSPWHRAYGHSRGELRHLASHRGVAQAVRIEVRTGAPFGVFVRRRQMVVPLHAPLYIAPRPRRKRWSMQSVPADAARDARETAPRLGGDAVRSVRPYVAGDAARLVHWPSSARRGTLVVRELEPPPRLGTAVVVDLTRGGDAAEAAAARAAGLARAVLAAGGECILCTREPTGPVGAPVRTARDIGRRLAAAVAGTPAQPPEGWPTEVIA
jgi:uncharacterized protein (DUF58 family)